MSEELEVLKLVTRRLESAGIPYMVTGSMAMNYYAVPRMTRDIDLVIEVSTGDADRVSDLFRADFYVDPEAVRRAVAERSTVNVIHDAFVVKVDLLVRKDTPYRLGEFARRRRVTVEGDGFFIVAPEDLVISKLDWARHSRSEVQLGDVRNLLASVADLDRAYLAEWTARLGLDALYQHVAADAAR